MASRDRLFCWNGLRRAQHDDPYDDQDRDINPSNVFVLNVASSIFAFNGHPEEGAKLADKSLRIDPRANSLSLNTLKDAYFYSRRFEDLIAVVSRVLEDARSRGSRLYLAFSYALLGQHDDAERARADVLARYP
jgi:predicted Zn-dependent protease